MVTVTLLVFTVALSVCAAVIAGVGLLVTLRRPEPLATSELARDVAALKLALADTVDKVEHWQRRDRVRKLRDANEQQQLPLEDPDVPLKERLRRQFGGMQ
jgi:hypothetical protein